MKISNGITDSVKNGSSFNSQPGLLISTLEKLVTTATKKRLPPIYEIHFFLIHSCKKLPRFKVVACLLLEF